MNASLHRRLLLALALLLPFAAWAKYPERPIKLVVPYPAGGTTDVLARLVARNMSTSLGQEVVVENKAGAATIIGVDAVAKAPNDGYTILLATATSFAVNPHLYKKLPYRLDEFVPIGFISEAPIVLVSPASSPAKDLPELIRGLKAPGVETAVATTGKGGFSHLTAAMFFNAINAKFRDVPYRGEAPALQDLLGGRWACTSAACRAPCSTSPRAACAATASRRWAARPPPRPSPRSPSRACRRWWPPPWFGLSAPRGTPADVVATLGAALNTAMQDKALLARMAAEGAVGRTLKPAEFSEFIRKDHERWGVIVRAANVEVDEPK
ncbi:tripartite tricarboxylate transporter substrate binding protein [Ramlibacter terrae]|uniref:Tripartite tricarboxylate transporter substrate binding protein n=1 Tax=Ramlibacter terrae TaxID=2732511 RepID=A0ABX6P702_9BURK|nr:tripartite tricarboxylate transporter substrate binding protein [Ramlibacter terrae]